MYRTRRRWPSTGPPTRSTSLGGMHPINSNPSMQGLINLNPSSIDSNPSSINANPSVVSTQTHPCINSSPSLHRINSNPSSPRGVSTRTPPYQLEPLGVSTQTPPCRILSEEMSHSQLQTPNPESYTLHPRKPRERAFFIDNLFVRIYSSSS